MNEVVAELDGSDFEDSEDDFDWYPYKRRHGVVHGDKERTEKENVLIGTNIEIESN